MAKHAEPLTPPAPKTTITTVHEQRGIILSILEDFLDEDALDRMFQWFDHVGFDIVALRDPHDLGPAWLGHYRRGRGYDMDRVFHDYLTWPPIAQRIAFLTKQKEEETARAAKKAKARKSAGRFGESHG